jgi:accessory colonization factor AcfC
VTIDEFRALKVGDRISNPMSNSSGVVNEVLHPRGFVHVYVKWDGSSKPIHFNEQMCVWMHWAKLQTEDQAKVRKEENERIIEQEIQREHRNKS